MPLIRVTQFLTSEGKIQIDITNTSGRPQYATAAQQRQDTTGSDHPLHPGLDAGHHSPDVPDRDEPCSLIVSLRASHPQFLYYRGPHQRSITSAHSVTSPLHLPGSGGGNSNSAGVGTGNNNGAGAGGGSGAGAGAHQRGPSSLWALEAIDPVIAEVSRQSWEDAGFAPLAPLDEGKPERGASPATSQRSLSNMACASPAAGDDRPLLVREELADCVLLPGERRTFMLEVDTPSVMDRLMAPLAPRKTQAQAPPPPAPLPDAPTSSGRRSREVGGGGARRSSLHPRFDVDDSGPSDKDTEHTFNSRTRGATNVFHQETPGGGGDRGGSLAPSSVAHSRRQAGRAGSTASDSNGDMDGSSSVAGVGAQHHPSHSGPTMLNKTQNPSSWTLPWGSPGESSNHPDPTQRDRHRSHQRHDGDDEDDHASASLRQPLSIAHDSTTTHGSADASQRGAAGAASGRTLGSRESSCDYAVPTPSMATPTSSSASMRTDPRAAWPSHSAPNVRPSGATSSAVSTPAPVHRWSNPGTSSQRPTFYVYYAPLGDENKCVDQARKWLLKEQQAYRTWLDQTVHLVTSLERRREHGWVRTGRNTVKSTQPSLGARRVLPPALGELVRWRADLDGGGGDGGGSGGSGGGGAVGDATAPSALTVAALQYYYSGLQAHGVVSRSISRLAVGNTSATRERPVGRYSSTSSGGGRGGERDENVVTPPPSFASSRHNRTSKKARKMFRPERQGSGTVVLPLRLSRQPPTTLSTAPTVAAAPTRPTSSPAKSTKAAATPKALPRSADFMGSSASLHSDLGPDRRPAAGAPDWEHSHSAWLAEEPRGRATGSVAASVSAGGGGSGEGSGNSAVAARLQPSSRFLRPYDSTAAHRPYDGNTSELGEYRCTSTPTSESRRFDVVQERPRFKSGRGLALLEDSITSPPSPSHTSGADYLDTLLESKCSFLAASNTKLGRTETLDPATAEMAAARLSPSRASSYTDPHSGTGRSGSSTENAASRPGLPTFRPRGEVTPPDAGPLGVTYPAAPHQPQLAMAGSVSSHLPTGPGTGRCAAPVGRVSRDNSGFYTSRVGATAAPPPLSHVESPSTAAGAATTASAEGPYVGSFVEKLLSSFCPTVGGLNNNAAGTSDGEDGDPNASPHVRDISSAPPQSLAYRRRNTNAGINPSFTGTRSSPPALSLSGSFTNLSMRSSQRLQWIAGQSKVAGGHVKVAAQHLTVTAGAAVATASDFVQEHGPPAVNGLLSVLNFVKDNVLTPYNVSMMQTVVTPMVMVCSLLAILYLIIAGGGDGSEAFLEGGGL